MIFSGILIYLAHKQKGILYKQKGILLMHALSLASFFEGRGIHPPPIKLTHYKLILDQIKSV